MIAAAGSGERLGAGGPKALVELAGRPLVAWCLAALAASEAISRAVIAAPAGEEGRLAELALPGLELEVVSGGASRSESVRAALAAAGADGGLVAVHDAARPLVEPELIDATVAALAAAPTAAGVIAAAPITDTVKRVAVPGGEPVEIAATEPRELLWSAQTPQVFRAEALREALAAPAEVLAGATDDASLVERAGGRVLIQPAPAGNLKVTTAADLELAELLLRRRALG